MAIGITSHNMLERARQRVAAAERLAAARGRCLSLAAQELRGPGLALMAQAASASPSHRLTESEAQVEAVAQQLLRLADDLADFATEPSPRALHEAPALLGPIVDAAIANVSAQLRPGRRHWKIEPDLGGLRVRADSRALEGALSALLRRAARHSRDGDVVALRYVVGTETLAIVVEDEGDGLPAQDLVVETAGLMPGGQAGGGTRGLDLGLSLARSLAAAHGGDIRLESAPGIGARAWLTLPRSRLLEVA
ncbi:sensor histidine kinase [Falsiroseomonas selenitidurans]|uniref:histidine kinase n=1 Tax=Falsiroseomonas selenitidurans TaxID=2716335 RepID=A0ABX1E442_9PROT|nr:HAMP domain-containing sensor histidine kinase [Falsiroseomonas selenitidurans]NKC31856.1 HAMP domain-containing histidine kinase [Falsiroseomonas selenitidurans]